MIKSIFVAASLLLTTLVTGCASTSIPLNYAPSSVMSSSGAVAVNDFKYLPAISGQVAVNQIRNTALGELKFDKNIDEFFRDAVFAELRFVGMKLDSPDRNLSGDIVEFLIDDLGYSIDWTLTVKYVVTNSAGKALYESEKVTSRKTDKFVNVFASLNETIKLNVEEVLKDQAFVRVVGAK